MTVIVVYVYMLIAFLALLPIYFSLEYTIPAQGDRILFSYLTCAVWPVTLLVVAAAFTYVLIEERIK